MEAVPLLLPFKARKLVIACEDTQSILSLSYPVAICIAGQGRNVAVESQLRHRELDNVLQHREITRG